MALKFLNKKGWHTGSLRNIENVWKAEQKNDAEQRKLDELRKQIQEERERAEFRLLQEQAGLIPIQERLDFLYDSGLAVGKGGSEGFKALEAPPQQPPANNAEASSSKANVPGALFEDKPQSANDTWRKLHSDPLLLIRQREQEALSRIKNNPIQMAMIRKSAESKKKHKKKEHTKHHKKSKHERHSLKQFDSEGSMSDRDEEGRKRGRQVSLHRKTSKREKHSSRGHSDSEGVTSEGEERRSHHQVVERHKSLKREKHSQRGQSDSEGAMSEGEGRRKRSHQADRHQPRGDQKNLKHNKHSSRGQSDSEGAMSDGGKRRHRSNQAGERHFPGPMHESENNHARIENHKRQQTAPKLSAEEKAARALEMQRDAELHEEQRWKRLKKASEADAREASRSSASGSRNFLDDAQKSVYGTKKGGSSTIEESVRRRTFYLQGKSEAHESNAFRR